MTTALKIIAVVLLVCANGFFVSTEFAIVSVRRSRIATLAGQGNSRARRLIGILNNLSAYISAIQLGVTLASLALGWIGEPTVARLLEKPLGAGNLISDTVRHTIAIAVAFTAITFFHIVLGELVPKTLALQRTERVALANAWLIQTFYRLFYWPIRILNWSGMRAVRLFGLHSSNEHASIYTEEELRQLVDISRKSGHLEAEEQRLINRVFDFSDAEVREAMVPRTAVAALPLSATLEEAEGAFRSSGYSRLPVYREQLDDIVGVLFLKNLLPCLRRVKPLPFNLEKLLRPPLFFPATARLGPVLQQMQSARMHLAFVVDEHGGIEGIVTLEDLLEEIVGEINDEYDEEAHDQIVKEDGSYLLDGMLAVRDANRHFNLHLPEEAGYTTMAGFLLAKSGRLLHPGETVEHDGGHFTVERVDRHRIRRIRFIPPANDGQGSIIMLFALFCASLAMRIIFR